MDWASETVTKSPPQLKVFFEGVTVVMFSLYGNKNPNYDTTAIILF